jgi:uncharacterized membrane protein (DUF373 family)
MLCSHCGKIIEDNGVVLQGHTFCNNICRYSFEKARKTDDINKIKRVDTKSQIHAAETVKKQNKTPSLQTYVDKRAKMSDFESIFNNKYFKLVSAILTALIALMIYRGISNHIENKQTFRILWICIGFVGFIATVAAKKHNKTPGQQTSVDNRGDKTFNFKSIFDNNYLKLVFAILTALLLYRGITNYIEYKQAEAALKDFDKDLDKTMIQFEKDMNKFIKK